MKKTVLAAIAVAICPMCHAQWWQAYSEKTGLVLSLHMADSAAEIYSPLQTADPLPVSQWHLGGDTLTINCKNIGFKTVLHRREEGWNGYWKQGMVRETIVFGPADTLFQPRRPQTPQPPYSFVEETIATDYVDSHGDSIHLEGTLTLPQGHDPSRHTRYPCLMLVSGSGQQNRDEEMFAHRPFLVLADYLTTDGQGHYRYAVRQQVMEGTFQRKRNGRNSFVPDDGGKSILVAERNALHAMDGDRVRVTMLARRYAHTREAQVIEILERAKDTFVGKLRVEHGFAFLITEDRALATDIFIPKKDLGKGCTGDKAVVRITDWPAGAKSPVGKVVDILGREGENDAEMHAILAEYNLPYNYPRRVEEAAERIPDGVTPEEIARREDFRSVTTFTIDPRDAKDFDDAISIRPMPAAHGKVYEVGVHIADVTHYIKEGDLIDREAQQRATSVYLVDRTIPMLPERLCNNLCSLREDEEKLAYSVIFRLSEGAVLEARQDSHPLQPALYLRGSPVYPRAERRGIG